MPDQLGTFFAGRDKGDEKIVIIKTDLYTAEVTTKGGLLRKWELNGYKTWDGKPVQLVDFDKGGDLSLLFTSIDGKLIDTKNLVFDVDGPRWKTDDADRHRFGEGFVHACRLPMAVGW